MKKKFKIVILIATILLFIIFLFASCRKTKAYTYDVEKPFFTQQYEFNAISKSGFAMIINVDKSASFNVLSIVGNNTSYYFIDCNYGVFRLSNFSTDLYTYNTASLPTSYFYIQFCYDYVEDLAYIYLSPIDFITGVSQGQAYVSNVILLNETTYWTLTRNDFLQEYTSSQPGTKVQLNWANSPYSSLLPGMIQFYLFDIDQQFSEDIYEQTELLFNDVKRDISLSYMNYLLTQIYDTGYDDGEQAGYDIGYDSGYDAGESAGEITGYQAGYDDGYDAGESAGYTSGYNAGYSAGESAGYDNGYRDGESAGYDAGYDAGTSAGYNTGYQAGYDDARDYWQPIYYQLGYEAGEVSGYNDGVQAGYTSGYNDGYEDGQAGETAVSPVFNIISGVFDVVASVLGIYLFPGITIGTFILVPLFFSIIGLVIWVWKKG